MFRKKGTTNKIVGKVWGNEGIIEYTRAGKN